MEEKKKQYYIANLNCTKDNKFILVEGNNLEYIWCDKCQESHRVLGYEESDYVEEEIPTYLEKEGIGSIIKENFKDPEFRAGFIYDSIAPDMYHLYRGSKSASYTKGRLASRILSFIITSIALVVVVIVFLIMLYIKSKNA